MSEKPMTPIEELDLARAKAILAASDLGMDWENAPSGLRHSCLHSARSIRLSDEARGLRVVPVEAITLIESMIANPASNYSTDALNGLFLMISDRLAASPYAPEEKP